jgi:hypothetical protein
VSLCCPRAERIAKFERPFEFRFVATDSTLLKFMFESFAPSNKKIPKHFLLWTLCDGKVKKLPSESTLLTPSQFPYQLKAKDFVVDKRTDGVAELQQLYKDSYPKLKSVFGYAPLQGPSMKVLEPTSTWAVEFPNKDTVAMLRAFSTMPNLLVAFVLEYSEQDLTLSPHAVAVLTAKQINIAAMERKDLL